MDILPNSDRIIFDNDDKIIPMKPWCSDCEFKIHKYRQPKRIPTYAYCRKYGAWLSYKSPIDFKFLAEQLVNAD